MHKVTLDTGFTRHVAMGGWGEAVVPKFLFFRPNHTYVLVRFTLLCTGFASEKRNMAKTF